MHKILKNWLMSLVLSPGEHQLVLALRNNAERLEFVENTLMFTDWQRKIATKYPRLSKDMIERFETVKDWDNARWARARWGADLGDFDFSRAVRAAEMNRFDFDRLCASYDRRHKKAMKGGE